MRPCLPHQLAVSAEGPCLMTQSCGRGKDGLGVRGVGVKGLGFHHSPESERHGVHVIAMVSHREATQTGGRSLGFEFRVLAVFST